MFVNFPFELIQLNVITLYEIIALFLFMSHLFELDFSLYRLMLTVLYFGINIKWHGWMKWRSVYKVNKQRWDFIQVIGKLITSDETIESHVFEVI